MADRITRFFLLLLLALAAPFVCAESAAGTVKVVYHLSDGNEQATRALGNIRNHMRADPSAKIVVVALSDGVRFLLDDARDRHGRPYAAMVTALATQGVEFRVCGNTLANFDIPMSKVSPQASVVPSGVAEVARLQAKEGFVYLRP